MVLTGNISIKDNLEIHILHTLIIEQGKTLAGVRFSLSLSLSRLHIAMQASTAHDSIIQSIFNRLALMERIHNKARIVKATQSATCPLIGAISITLK